MNNSADLLLFWMSHQGAVSDGTLRAASDSLLYDRNDEKRTLFFRTVHQRFRWLAYIEREEKRWRVTRPRLLMLQMNAGQEEGITEAVFSGGRTPQTLTHWKNIVTAHQCAISEEHLFNAPTRISVKGHSDAIARAAVALDISVIHDAPQQALCVARDLEQWGQNAPVTPPPSGVSPDIYEMATGEWIPGEPKENDACRYKPIHGVTSFFSLLAQGFVKTNDAGEAVFLAASQRRHTLCTYDEETQQFISPIDVPSKIARALCLCSARPPKSVAGRRRVFSGVPRPIAMAALKQLGQDFSSLTLTSPEFQACPPLIHWFDRFATDAI